MRWDFPPVAGHDAGKVLPQGVWVHVKRPLRQEEELVLAVTTVLKALKVLPGSLPEGAVAPVPCLREPHPLHHPITQTSPSPPPPVCTFHKKKHFVQKAVVGLRLHSGLRPSRTGVTLRLAAAPVGRTLNTLNTRLFQPARHHREKLLPPYITLVSSKRQTQDQFFLACSIRRNCDAAFFQKKTFKLQNRKILQA